MARIFLSAVFLVVALDAQAQPPSQELPEATNQTRDDQEVGEDGRGAIVDELGAIGAELRAISEQAARIEQDRAESDAAPGPPVFSNWVLILITGGAVIAAFRSLGILRQQADASTEAARAAKVSADALMIAERAQLAVPYGEWRLETDLDNADRRRQATIHYNIKNLGRTAAVVNSLRVFMSRHESRDTPPPMKFGDLDPDPSFSGALIGPSDSLPRTVLPFFLASDDEREKLASGELLYWIQGRIEYRDVFKTPRFTNFTARVHLPSSTFVFDYRQGYNDAE